MNDGSTRLGMQQRSDSETGCGDGRGSDWLLVFLRCLIRY